MGTVSFLPDVGNSQVFQRVTNIIASTLDRADAVYKDAKTNLDAIKATAVKYTPNYTLHSSLNIATDSYDKAGFIGMTYKDVEDISLSKNLAVPTKLTLDDITPVIEFDDSIEKVNRNISEPNDPTVDFKSLATALYYLRPPKENIGDINNNITVDSVTKPDVYVNEPDIPSINYDSLANALLQLRPEIKDISDINSNVKLDDNSRPNIYINEPDIPSSPIISTIEKPDILVLDNIDVLVDVDTVDKPIVNFITPPIPKLPDIGYIDEPVFEFNFNEDFYKSELGSYVYNLILDELKNGSTGLSPQTELDIYFRESERDTYQLQITKDRISNMWAETGLSLPDGVLVSALSAAELEYQNKYSDKSRDIRIESFKRADDNAKFIKDLSIKYEQILMDYMAKYWDRKLDAAKSVLNLSLLFYDAVVKYQSIFIERYKAEVEGYKATVEGQAAELESKAKIYTGEISYVLGKADVELKEIATELDIQKTKITNKQLEISAYDSEIKYGALEVDKYSADVSKFGSIYNGRIASGDIEAKLYPTDVQYILGKADTDIKNISNTIEDHKNKITQDGSKIARYDADIKRISGYVDNHRVETEKFNSVFSNRVLTKELNTKSYPNEVQYALGKADVEIKSSSNDIESQRNKISLMGVDVERYNSDIKHSNLYLDNYKLDIEKFNTVYSMRIAKLEAYIKEMVSELDYEKAKAEVEIQRVQALVESQKAKVTAKQSEVDVFSNEVKYEAEKAEIKAKKILAYSEEYKAAAAVHSTNVQYSDVDSKFKLGRMQNILEAIKLEIDALKVSVDATVAATGNIAHVSSTMVAGALSSLNANASIGANESQSSNESYSNQKMESKSTSVSTAINTIYNHEE